ncbi:hypothetical protein KL86CLO1_11652 [uncultured Eubacteriales bacterium]|uniref:Uncharacterized protein n=1 Tax=uncultured Eubacteriales bacterium TaxID=172733 RepID=A0A212JSQ7_9FIRM|nr:hypothetical protein KL86CLO1_11652 [uncultured Eubacteriales bacterium]
MMIKCDPSAIARCPYKRSCGDNPYFLDGSDCDKFNQKVLEPPPTNADRIRSMSDKELAEFIILSPEMEFEVCRYCKYGNTVPDDRGQCLAPRGHCIAQDRCDALKIYLRQPVKEGQMMELQEAIIHTRQVAEGCGVDSCDCAYQHDQLGDWLEELQTYRALGTVEQLAQFAQAQQDGRLVVLPCKFGGTVYVIETNCVGLPVCIFESSFNNHMLYSVGKTVFLTREEAEAAITKENRPN